MFVKIGDQIFDSQEVSIMICLTEREFFDISNRNDLQGIEAPYVFVPDIVAGIHSEAHEKALEFRDQCSELMRNAENDLPA